MPDLPKHSESYDADAAAERGKSARSTVLSVVAAAVVAVIVLVIVLHLTGVIDTGGGH